MMTEADAAEWAAHNGKTLQKADGKPEMRRVGEPYVGWGGGASPSPGMKPKE